MPVLSHWSRPQLLKALQGDGLFLSVSPFVVHVRSDVPVVADGLHALYAEHQAWLEPTGFVDFRVAVKAGGWPWSPQSHFELDGRRPFTPLARSEAYAFFEWGLNWCVTSHCHRWIHIHAAVLEKNGLAVLLPAPPGSGKSTLCAALMLHGWRLLSDELAMLDPVDGMLVPNPRPISLKNASIELISGRKGTLNMGPVARDTQKGTVCHLQVASHCIELADVRARPAWVVFPRYMAGADLQAAPLSRPHTLLQLQRNSFNRHLHGHAGFHALADLVDRSSSHELTYSRLNDALAWFDALEAEHA
ncbi:HprK-related kinase A [Aquabacterium lacunae]|uniref:HprK-related kinase A n=1 Tax=Aquabacterium lacunae TaxID=2528630 RepID=A0A4Q9H178_9BURK|nr:HprK-related kinase A [Aquabacterium lacunae]TBO30219.1 HprK-related kinase A [Aquabacterium lacunae]